MQTLCAETVETDIDELIGDHPVMFSFTGGFWLSFLWNAFV